MPDHSSTSHTQQAYPVMRHVPNVLTTARLCAIPVFAWLFLLDDGAHLKAASLLFAAIAFTDFLDGWLARRYHVTSVYGKIVDPLADRLLVGTTAVLVALSDMLIGIDLGLPWWALLAVIWRDAIAIAGFFAARRKVVIPDVNRVGKAATFMMMSGLCWIMYFEGATWTHVVFWIGFGLSIVALVEYWQRYRWVVNGGPRPAWASRNQDAQTPPNDVYSATASPTGDDDTTVEDSSGTAS